MRKISTRMKCSVLCDVVFISVDFSFFFFVSSSPKTRKQLLYLSFLQRPWTQKKVGKANSSCNFASDNDKGSFSVRMCKV